MSYHFLNKPKCAEAPNSHFMLDTSILYSILHDSVQWAILQESSRTCWTIMYSRDFTMWPTSFQSGRVWLDFLTDFLWLVIIRVCITHCAVYFFLFTCYQDSQVTFLFVVEGCDNCHMSKVSLSARRGPGEILCNKKKKSFPIRWSRHP